MPCFVLRCSSLPVYCACVNCFAAASKGFAFCSEGQSFTAGVSKHPNSTWEYVS